MPKTIRERFWNWRVVLVTTPSVTLAVILLRLTGILQTLELAAYDQYMRWRPPETRDSRIVIVGIDENDLQFIGQGYVPDGVYFELIQRLNAMNPRVIGLDIYRDLPFEPGHSQLVRLFETTDNLIGIEKVIGDHFFSRVGPPPALAARGQVGANDLIVDQDNRVRRALLYFPRENGETVHSFAVHLALRYLSAEPDFSVEIVEGTDNWWKFGDVVFVPFEGNDGGYVRADDGGYQVLLNYRGPSQHFEIVSMRDIFENRVASDWGSDRIILIGSVGESMKDLFSIPYTLAPDQRMTGVEIHANIVSKIISAALENRPLIRTLPEVVEWLLIMFWSGLGATLTWRLRDPTRVGQFLFKRVVILVLAGCIVLSVFGVAITFVLGIQEIVKSIGLLNKSRGLEELETVSEAPKTTYMLYMSGVVAVFAVLISVLSVANLMITNHRNRVFKRIATEQMQQLRDEFLQQVSLLNEPPRTDVPDTLDDLIRSVKKLSFVNDITLYLPDQQDDIIIWNYNSMWVDNPKKGFERQIVAKEYEQAIQIAFRGQPELLQALNGKSSFQWYYLIRDQQNQPLAVLRINGNERENFREYKLK